MVKRLFDVFFSLINLLIIGLLIFFFIVLAAIDTQSSGLYVQIRVGQFGKRFKIFKLRTIHPKTGQISRIGFFYRKYKLDELPQLFNVLIGDMSVVGPRPDVPGYYDVLKGEERKILDLKPGLTSEASIKYANEEELLSEKENPLKYNNKVIFPDKVKMNLDYYYSRSFWGDIKIICNTVFRK